ncbi:hypothetical protein EP073_10480 [Geovibrio thiophilus]|uniref:AMP-activated protein kinase glycogen-binding domain-containing protein n=1 Tax=Geovibrio thiophilus TaxID=139438 RepID=A0A3R5Z061_9BACT|nr:glycogen-binding domain-containing protein [Geovibrio thiophilus]QAR33816.1 hypothetical protein EP073_10480 [Geovibrio thiophilus]
MNGEKEVLISQFIDNELSLDEKITFVHEIRTDRAFSDEAIELLETEKLLRTEDIKVPPVPIFSEKRRSFLIPFGISTAFAAAAVFMLFFRLTAPTPEPAAVSAEHRFILHMPEAQKVELAGSFNGWKTIEMNKTDSSGYWQVSLPLNKGEYAYSFIINGDERITDPTIKAKQADDFGGENSVISIGDRI